VTRPERHSYSYAVQQKSIVYCHTSIIPGENDLVVIFTKRDGTGGVRKPFLLFHVPSSRRELFCVEFLHALVIGRRLIIIGNNSGTWLGEVLVINLLNELQTFSPADSKFL
jgi:hypothetical protein